VFTQNKKKQGQLPYVLNLTISVIARSLIIYPNIFWKIKKIRMNGFLCVFWPAARLNKSHTGATLAKLYFALGLRLPLDLLRDSFPNGRFPKI